MRKDSKRNESNRFCNHCHKSGHTENQCFQLVGYPDCYEGPRDNTKGKRNTKATANAVHQASLVDSPLDDTGMSEEATNPRSHLDNSFIQAVAQEMMKLMKGKSIDQKPENMSSYAHFVGIVSTSPHSNVCNAMRNNDSVSWIVDTRASDHMTYNFNLFTSHKTLSSPINITLPDGTLQQVSMIGEIPLNTKLILHNILYVPGFKFNLLSVSKLLTDYSLCALFYPDKCFFQNPTTKLVVDPDLKANGLYKIKILAAQDRTLGH